MFKITIALKLILCYNLSMKLKIAILIGLIFFTACSPKQITIFKRYISNQKLKITKLDSSTKSDNMYIILTPQDKFTHGTFKGFAGCNNFKGTFTLNRDYINFFIQNIGQKVCDNLYRESIFIHKLAKTKQIYFENNRVIFEDKNSNWLMTFMRVK